LLSITIGTQDTLDSVVAGKGILSSAIATGLFGFITVILFLFCTPDLETVFALNIPQPFVQIYALALGKGGGVFMTIIAVIGLMLVRGRPSSLNIDTQLCTYSEHQCRRRCIL
jgi:amino acid transporter